MLLERFRQLVELKKEQGLHHRVMNPLPARSRGVPRGGFASRVYLTFRSKNMKRASSFAVTAFAVAVMALFVPRRLGGRSGLGPDQ